MTTLGCSLGPNNKYSIVTKIPCYYIGIEKMYYKYFYAETKNMRTKLISLLFHTNYQRITAVSYITAKFITSFFYLKITVIAVYFALLKFQYYCLAFSGILSYRIS